MMEDGYPNGGGYMGPDGGVSQPDGNEYERHPGIEYVDYDDGAYPAGGLPYPDGSDGSDYDTHGPPLHHYPDGGNGEPEVPDESYPGGDPAPIDYITPKGGDPPPVDYTMPEGGGGGGPVDYMMPEGGDRPPVDNMMPEEGGGGGPGPPITSEEMGSSEHHGWRLRPVPKHHGYRPSPRPRPHTRPFHPHSYHMGGGHYSGGKMG